MIVLSAALASLAVVAVSKRAGLLLGALSAVFVHPALGLALAGFVFVIYRGKAILKQRRSKRALIEDEHLAVDLAALGVTAGLSFDQAAVVAGDRVGGLVATNVRKAVRRAQSGLPREIHDGPVSVMFSSADRSSHSGAPISVALADLARHGREDLAAEEQERLEKLPVKLLFPLAFLILPGFVLVAVVPAVVSGLGKLGL
ncbi:MAG: type II secretion system F family protein [Acidimicrobiia bacterium]